MFFLFGVVLPFFAGGARAGALDTPFWPTDLLFFAGVSSIFGVRYPILGRFFPRHRLF